MHPRSILKLQFPQFFVRNASRFARNVLPIRTILAGAIVATAASANAVDGAWNTDANGNWSLSDANPWLGAVAEGADFTADFSTIDITADRTVTLTAPLTIGNLIFEDDTTASNMWTLTGSTLTLDTTNGTPTINIINRTARINTILAGNDGLVKSGAGTLILAGNNTFTGTTTINSGTLQIGADAGSGSINGDIVNNATLRVQRNNAITLVGNITGTGSLTKANSGGVLTLTGNNTYSGGTTLSDGALLLSTGTNNGIGTGALTIGRGRLGSSDNNSRTINNVLNLNISGNLTFGASQGATDGLGDLIFADATTGAGPGGSTAIMVNNSTTVTLNKRFTNGQITKAGTGTLVLAGASTYTSATIVSAGTLAVSGSIAGSASITVQNSGSLLLGGTSDRIKDTALITLGGGTGTGPATLKLDNSLGQISETVGALTLASNSILDFGTGSAGAILNFADSLSQLWTGTLSIYNWTPGKDQLFFGNSNFALSDDQLKSIVFYSDAGTTSLGAASILGDGQVIAAVPEPSTLLSALGFAGGLVCFRPRRRA